MTNHSGPIIAHRDSLTVIQCSECGFAHLDKFPSESELAEFYKSDFWTKEKSGGLADFERQAEWWAAVHSDWLSIVESHTGGRTLLDVGCGYGFFIKVAQEREWGVAGIDSSRDAIEYAKKNLPYGYALACGDWQGVTSLPEKMNFNCISAHWLIEHLPNPLDFLTWCKSHLAPGGVLLTAIPQEWTQAQAEANEIVKKKNWFLDKTHLSYFSQTSFSNLLGRAGFRIVDMLATYPMETFISETLDYTTVPAIGRSLHESIERRELSLTRAQRLSEYRKRAREGRGRDLVVIAKAN